VTTPFDGATTTYYAPAAPKNLRLSGGYGIAGLSATLFLHRFKVMYIQ